MKQEQIDRINALYRKSQAEGLTEAEKEEQRFENPHEHYLDMSPAYYEMKMDMLHESRTK